MTAETGDHDEDSRLSVRTKDLDEAEAVLADLYLPVQIIPGHGAVDFTLDALQLETMTAGRMSYGHDIRLETAEADHYHVDVPLRGRAVFSSGRSRQVTASPVRAAVFVPSQTAMIDWPADCEQLCIMIRPAALEVEIEQLLGRSLARHVTFERAMDLTTPVGRSWRNALNVLIQGLDSDGPDLTTNAYSRHHLERLLLDGLLLGHRHNYTDALLQWPSPPSRRTVAQAVALLEDRFPEAWSTSVLARAVGASVRSLQEGFKRDVGVPPMTYLQNVRLRHAHHRLATAKADKTSVTMVARACGFTHLGRFALLYRRRFGEPPSTTLRRHAPTAR
jgi:AraC-like DNA-binding protein